MNIPGRFIRSSFPAWSVIAALTLGAGPSVGAAAEPDYTVDQRHDPDELWSSYSIKLLTPMGQEFVPQQASLDVVELWIFHGVTGTEPPADVFVRIREGSIAGPVLGQSAKVTVHDEHDAATRFEFDAPIALTPGSMYVIEAMVGDVPGAGNPMVGAAPAPGYPAGTYITSGVQRMGSDLWFRTGLRGDVPARAVSWGEVKSRYPR